LNVADLDQRISVQIPKEMSPWVKAMAADLGLTSNTLVVQLLQEIKEMMDEPEPTLPATVQQYRALQAAGALRSQLQKNKIPLAPSSLGASASSDPKKKK